MGAREREEIEDQEDETRSNGMIEVGDPGDDGDLELFEDTDEEDDQEETEDLSDDDGDDSDDDDSSEEEPEELSAEDQRKRNRSKRQTRRQRKRGEREARENLIKSQSETIHQLQERLAAVESRQGSGDLARLDSAIETAKRNMGIARRRRAEAIESGDSEAFEAADEAFRENERAAIGYESVKQRYVQAQRQPQPTRPDPNLQRHAQSWMDRNTWFDPNGSDEDSRITSAIDDGLVAEGWNPSTREYWDELTARTRERLPHLFEGRQQRQRKKSPVRGGGNGGGRSGGAAAPLTAFEREAVKNWKAAGFTDAEIRTELKRARANQR